MNKYEVLGEIYQGEDSVVLKCHNKETKETVAIKKFNYQNDETIYRKSAQRELKILKLLKQENIVQLQDAFINKMRLYLVFEYVDKNLLEVLEEQPNGLDPEQVRKLIYQLVKAINYCNNFNIIHRDIKPENILVSGQGNLKLCGFGYAREFPQNGNNLTDYVTTRWYRAPELLLYSNYGKEVDMWAIGCIMGELTDSQALFPGDNEIDQLYVIQKVLGSLTLEQQEQFIKNPRFLGMKFPEITHPETLEKRYLGKLSNKALQFLKGLLKLDPKERMTSYEAIQHPYFDGLRDDSSHKSQALSQNNKEILNSANKVDLQSNIVNSIGNIKSKKRNKIPFSTDLLFFFFLGILIYFVLSFCVSIYY